MSIKNKSWSTKLAKVNHLSEIDAANKLKIDAKKLSIIKNLIGEIVPQEKRPLKNIKRQPKKHSKIKTAFLNIPKEPELLESFAIKMNVSPRVLRQSRRFIKEMNLNIGQVVIERNTNGDLIIYGKNNNE